MKVDRIQQLASRLERWRKKHRPPTPIPLDIWVEAAELARAEGPGPISRRLGLDYGCLKKREFPAKMLKTDGLFHKADPSGNLNPGGAGARLLREPDRAARGSSTAATRRG